MKDVDVIIIGSGASGFLSASYLVNKGFRVLMLEQGDYVRQHTKYTNLLTDAEPAFTKNAAGSFELNGYPWSTSNVGGGTVFYGGASFRYREVDFDASKYIQSDLDCKFPYSYNELMAYYDSVEEMIGVARSSNIDPCEPPGGSPVMPAHPYSYEGEMIAHTARSMGLNPFPTPLAINSMDYKGRPACRKHSQCIEKQCQIGAKGDVMTVFAEELAQNKNFGMLHNTKAVRILQQSGHSVSGVECLRLGMNVRETFFAPVIILACNAVQSAALLLKSSSLHCPWGIGNDYGMVGRGLSYKLSEYVSGVAAVTAKAAAYEGPFSTVSITDYYLHDECPCRIGGLIYEARLPDPPTLNSDEAFLRVECIISDHPKFENRVFLSDKKDKNGEPVLVLDYTTDPKDTQRLQYMTEQCRRILAASGAANISHELSYYYLGSGHLHGTCRAGKDPRQYVLDEYCRVHSTDNLFVVDGSFMPYSGGLNPTLTIQANALRTTEYISNRFNHLI